MTDKARLRKSVLWFAEQMELTLRKHDGRGGWLDENLDYLIDRLQEEVDELRDVLQDHPMSDEKLAAIIGECCDVANFAMMIADRTADGRRYGAAAWNETDYHTRGEA